MQRILLHPGQQQALNGIVRLARDLKSYLWVADPRQVTFLCLSKEKSPKEMTPRSRRLPPPLLARPGARLTRRAQNTRLGLDQKSRDTPEAGCDARRRLRGPYNTHISGSA